MHVRTRHQVYYSYFCLVSSEWCVSTLPRVPYIGLVSRVFDPIPQDGATDEGAPPCFRHAVMYTGTMRILRGVDPWVGGITTPQKSRRFHFTTDPRWLAICMHAQKKHRCTVRTYKKRKIFPTRRPYRGLETAPLRRATAAL